MMHRTSFMRLVATWLLAWAASWAAHAQDGDGNYLHFETVTATAGEAWTSEIRRVSEEPIKGMQFDLTWPEGVAFDMDAMALSPEWDAFQLSVSMLGDNTYRVLVFNFAGATVPEGDVGVAQVSGTMSVDVAAGAYAVALSDVILSNGNNENVAEDPLEVGSIVVTSAGCPADLNADGAVGSADLLLLLPLFGCTENCGYIDLNGDGVVGVGEVGQRAERQDRVFSKQRRPKTGRLGH